MKVLFDTSVLIAAMTAKHPKHQLALSWAVRANKQDIQAYMSTHALAELYSVLTGHPQWRISPGACQQSLTIIQKTIQTVSLSTEDYIWIIDRMAKLGLSGGTTYDLIHAKAALNSGVDHLLTLNDKHFSRLGKDIAAFVKNV